MRHAPIRLLVTFLFHGSALGAGAAKSVGSVTKVQNLAQIGFATAVVGSPVRMNDRLRTGANVRLQITFRDNSLLTLGENANVVVDRFVFNPERSKGEVALSATRGAFRFAEEKIEQTQTKKVTVSPPQQRLPCAASGAEGTCAAPISGPDPLMGNMVCCQPLWLYRLVMVRSCEPATARVAKRVSTTIGERFILSGCAETRRYRGYDLVPMRQWSQWCVGIYPTRADLPILTRSTLSNLAAQKEDAVDEAKQKIDRILARLNYPHAK